MEFSVLYAFSHLNYFSLYNNLWLVLILSLFHYWKKWSLESLSEHSWPLGLNDWHRDRLSPSRVLTQHSQLDLADEPFSGHKVTASPVRWAPRFTFMWRNLCRRREWNPDTEKSRDKDGEKEFWWHSKSYLWVSASLMEASLRSAFVTWPLGESQPPRVYTPCYPASRCYHGCQNMRAHNWGPELTVICQICKQENFPHNITPLLLNTFCFSSEGSCLSHYFAQAS